VDERLSATTGTSGTISTADADGESEGERRQRRRLRVLLASQVLSVRASPQA